jgi:hypothetical protein
VNGRTPVVARDDLVVDSRVFVPYRLSGPLGEGLAGRIDLVTTESTKSIESDFIDKVTATTLANLTGIGACIRVAAPAQGCLRQPVVHGMNY